MIYLSLFPEIHPFIMVCLPWFWVMVRGNQDGGFLVELEKAPKDGLPEQIAYIEFFPYQIRGKYWRVPNTPERWRWEIIWAWDDLIKWLKGFWP